MLQIRLKTLKRRARLLYVPAFVADYVYGEHFNVHGVRRPEQFQAVIGGLQGAGVAAERHFSPQKVHRGFSCCGLLLSLLSAFCDRVMPIKSGRARRNLLCHL